MDPTNDLVDRVHRLSDLELAVLLSLVSEEHCVIGTPEDCVDDLANELRLITRNIFGLQCVSVDCHELMTLEELIASLLLPEKALPATDGGKRSEKNIKRSKCGSHSSGSGDGQTSGEAPDAGEADPCMAPAASTFLHTVAAHSPRLSCGDIRMPTTAGPDAPAAASSAAVSAFAPNAVLSLGNVVIAKRLNIAPEAVQSQILELLRMQRISTCAAPKPFLFVGVVAAMRGFGWNAGQFRSGQDGREPHMTAYLNDFFCMGHWHDPEDGFPNVEEEAEAEAGAETADTSSEEGNYERHTTRIGRARLRKASPSFFFLADIHRLAALSNSVRVDIEVLRYLMNVVAFLRMHRAVATVGPRASGLSSISPAATRHFQKLAQCLATLHRLDYVTPALVALAARKTYLHRIRMTYKHKGGNSRMGTPITHERSMQWGSESAAMEALVDGVTPEDIIDDVLALVATPV